MREEEGVAVREEARVISSRGWLRGGGEDSFFVCFRWAFCAACVRDLLRRLEDLSCCCDLGVRRIRT